MDRKAQLIGCTIAGIIIGSLTVVGANQTIQAIQNTEIKVSFEGQVQTFRDEITGEVQYPITYHDRTYLPLRNVASLSGLLVDYDEFTNTAILRKQKTDDKQVVEELQDYNVKIYLKNELPMIIYGPYVTYLLRNKYWHSVTSFDYSVEGTNITLNFAGVKMYDADGSSNERQVCVHWILYDENDNVVKDGRAYANNVRTTEYYECKSVINGIESGNYYLEISENAP